MSLISKIRSVSLRDRYIITQAGEGTAEIFILSCRLTGNQCTIVEAPKHLKVNLHHSEGAEVILEYNHKKHYWQFNGRVLRRNEVVSFLNLFGFTEIAHCF